MKSIYFAGHMIINDNNEIDMDNDYRACILGDRANQIVNSFVEPIPLTPIYGYGYPSFYYADADGNPSIASDLIIKTERRTLKETDILVAYLGTKPTAGTLGEIMYASLNGTETYIYYEPSKTDSLIYQTNQWYPIMMAKAELGDRCHIKEIKSVHHFLDELYVDFGIVTEKYPTIKILEEV